MWTLGGQLQRGEREAGPGVLEGSSGSGGAGEGSAQPALEAAPVSFLVLKCQVVTVLLTPPGSFSGSLTLTLGPNAQDPWEKLFCSALRTGRCSRTSLNMTSSRKPTGKHPLRSLGKPGIL